MIVIEPTLMSQRPPHEPAVIVSQPGVSNFDLDAEALGDLGRDVDVEAFERAVRLQERLRRVVRVGRDHELLCLEDLVEQSARDGRRRRSSETAALPAGLAAVDGAPPDAPDVAALAPPLAPPPPPALEHPANTTADMKTSEVIRLNMKSSFLPIEGCGGRTARGTGTEVCNARRRGELMTAGRPRARS